MREVVLARYPTTSGNHLCVVSGMVMPGSGLANVTALEREKTLTLNKDDAAVYGVARMMSIRMK